MKRTRSMRSYADGSARRMGDPPRGGDPLREGPELRIEPRPGRATEPRTGRATEPRPIRPAQPRQTGAHDDVAPILSPADPPVRSDQESLHNAIRRIAERSATRPGHHRSAGTGLAGWLRRRLRKLPFLAR